MSSVVEIVKIWLVTYAITKPITWVVIIALFSVLLLLSAIFFKFKNSWFSIISFIILEFLAVATAVILCGRYFIFNELHLNEGVDKRVVSVTPEGVIFERRIFKNRATPLLGIELPAEGSEYYTQAKDIILNSRFNNSLRVYESSAYKGVVLHNARGNSINEELLINGLAYASSVSPKSYIKLQNKAIESSRGIWSKSCSIRCLECSDLVDYTVFWLMILYTLAIAIVIPWQNKKRKLRGTHSQIISPTQK